MLVCFSLRHIIYLMLADESESVAHCVHPADVGADLCEDSRLLEDVAALTRTKTHHTANIPGAVSVLAIQRATRVSLCG